MNSINCIGIILAGGKSTRMGKPKGLLDFFGSFWLEEQLKRLKLGGIKTVYIGLGYDADEYFKAIPFLKTCKKKEFFINGLKIRVIVNNNPELGSFSTLKKVLKEIPKSNNVLIIPIDVPILNPVEINGLINRKETVVKPQYQGKTGHPIFINNILIDKILSLPKDARLDYFINSLPKSMLKLYHCNDSQITININTPNNWKLYKTYYQTIYNSINRRFIGN